MSLTDRDRKILAVLVALALIAAYWFLILGPKREEARVAADELTEQTERRDAAVAQVADLKEAEASFEKDYATVIRLGKAIPSTVDVPSLMVQLQDAARGTSISFDSITASDREAAPLPAPPPPSGGGEASTEETPAEAPTPAPAGEPSTSTASTSTGSTPPPTSSGSTAPASPAEGSTGSTASGSTTPSPASPTSPPAEGGTTTTPSPTGEATPTGDPAAATTPALESVPLDFEFRGSFFELADFFHEMKRFVHVANANQVDVSGRLMTIDSITMSSDESFPVLTAEVSATAYVAPAAQGTTAGATPQGPAGATPADTQSVAGSSSGEQASPPSATAVTP